MPIKYVTIPLPEEIWDVEGATVKRRKRISVARMDDLQDIAQEAQDPEALYSNLAELIPSWEGVLDVETGEPLPDPQDDPMVFSRVDITEQFPWLMELLKMTPGKLKKAQGPGQI